MTALLEDTNLLDGLVASLEKNISCDCPYEPCDRPAVYRIFCTICSGAVLYCDMHATRQWDYILRYQSDNQVMDCGACGHRDLPLNYIRMEPVVL